jgi:hypothetical protein
MSCQLLWRNGYRTSLRSWGLWVRVPLEAIRSFFSCFEIFFYPAAWNNNYGVYVLQLVCVLSGERGGWAGEASVHAASENDI